MHHLFALLARGRINRAPEERILTVAVSKSKFRWIVISLAVRRMKETDDSGRD